MKTKVTNALFVSALALSFSSLAYGQNTKSLSDLQGLETSRDRSNSPSQEKSQNEKRSSKRTGSNGKT